MKNSGSRIASGMFWRFGERIAAQAITFIVSVVLARILTPEEYGLIAITMVFISLLNVFVTSGFGTALIQKKEVDNLDFSTVQVSGFVISVLVYLGLFFAAPTIALFYEEPQLAIILRFMALKLPLASINSVQQAYVSRKMIFKKFFFATLIGTLVSAIIGIYMAYSGMGVWSLVAQYLSNSLISTVVLGIVLKWWPGLKFSLKRFKGLFAFGWRMLSSDFLHTLYTQLRSLIIGKWYSASQLGFYSKGQQIPHLFVTNIGVAISSVLFPAFSQTQDDKKKLKEMLSRAIQCSMFVMLPVMVGLAVVSSPVISLVYTDKWLSAVPFLQLACVEFATEPWNSANLQAIKALGESKLYQRNEFLKKAIAVTMLLFSVRFGVTAIAASACLYSFVALFLSAFPMKRLMGYGFTAQIKDNFKTIFATLVMGLAVRLVNFVEVNTVFCLIIQICVGVIVYIVCSILVKNNCLRELLGIIRKTQGRNC